jgi:hypothetical protein
MLFWCAVAVGAVVLSIAAFVIYIRVWIDDYSECED